MSNPIRPTVLDIGRAVALLNEHATADPKRYVETDGITYSIDELRIKVATNLAYVTGKQVRLGRVTGREVSLMLSAWGASDDTIRLHSRQIAQLMRGSLSFEHGSWSSWL